MSVFSTDVRIVMCASCGSPVTTPRFGGEYQCAHCHTKGTVPARSDRGDFTMLSQGQQQARVEMLRAQAANPKNDPYSLRMPLDDVAHLVGMTPDSFLPAWQREWARAVGLLHTARSMTSERRVYWLAATLAAAKTQMDGTTLRAVIETALDLLSDPGHRQILRCVLSRRAAASGDSASAVKWVAGCDPAPGNLTVDSEQRLARAMASASAGKWNDVLDAVGAKPDAFPCSEARMALLGAYRAHALAKLDQKAEGQALFDALIMKDRSGVLQMMDAEAWIGLCKMFDA
jgi:hypothetical protein